MENIILWLQLSFTLGGTGAGGKLLRRYRTADALFSLDPALLVKTGELTEATAEKLIRARSLRGRAQSVAAVCRNFGWQVLTPENKFYPQEFFYLKDPPYAIYAMGDLTYLSHRHKAAVVGTRAPAPVAVRAAYDIGAVLSQNNVVTVSGGALGIDSAAHEGALTAGGGTVCMLGMGLGHQYLPEKAFMRRRIARRGVLLSEIVPFEGPTAATFPRRNRLIAAIAGSLTVVQSGERGGSMISADYALQYGRQLFALSPEVFPSPGCEKLIREGAAPLDNAAALLSFYGAAEGEDWPLANGGSIPPVLTPTLCTLQEFARLNGVTEAEALPLYEELCGRAAAAAPYEIKNSLTGKNTPVKKTAVSRPPAEGPAAKAAPPPKNTGPDATQMLRIADAQRLSGDERAVFLALSGEPRSLDAVADQTGLSAPAVMTALTFLELAGLADTLPGNRAAVHIGA